MKKHYFEKHFGDFNVGDWIVWLGGLAVVIYFVIEKL